MKPNKPIDTPAPSSTRPSAIVGRDRELQILTGLLDDTNRGGAALILQGGPGVGKSALLRAGVQHGLESGMVLLQTSGVETETDMPFAGLHQLLRPVLAKSDELPTVQRDALLAAFGGSNDPPELFLIALAALNLLSDAAVDAPVLVVAEDAHWLDAPTCDVLTFVARRLESDPIVLLAAIREEMETGFARAGIPQIQLGPLGEEDAAALLDSQAPGLSPETRCRVLAEAAGNPLALIELPIGWQARGDEGPHRSDWLPLTERLERAFASRARRLAPRTQTMLLVASLDEGEALNEILEATSLLCVDEITIQDLSPAESSGLVEVYEDNLQFRHPLIRSAIRQAATAQDRHRAHAALADVLRHDPDRSVWHRAASVLGPNETVARELELVAARAQRRGGAATAANALERAAALTADRTTRGARLLSAAELAFEVGRHDVVARLLSEAELLELTEPDVHRIRWLREFIRDGTGAGTVESLVAMADHMIQDDRIDLATSALQTASFNCWWFPGDRGREQLVVAAAGRLPGDQGDPTRLAIQALADPVGSGPRLMDRLSSFALDPERDYMAMRFVGTALTVILSFHDAKAYLVAVVAALREQGRQGLVAHTLVSLADAAFYSDDWDLALQAADEDIRLAMEVGNPRWSAVSQLTRAKVEGMRGQEDIASGLIGEAELTLEGLSLAPMFCYIEQARAVTALGAGRYTEALEHGLRGFDPKNRAYSPVDALKHVADVVEAAVHTGRQREVVVAVAQLEAMADTSQSPFLRSNLDFVRALLAEDDQADALFSVGLSSRHSLQMPFLRARLSLAYGAWLRRRQRIAESRVALRSAREAFDILGAAPWADRARHELRASGETSRQNAPDSRVTLTSQEMQIAQMAAAGLTNREIGQRLFLSHRTVGSHLYRLFPKLGISSRSDLPRRLSGEAQRSDIAGDEP